MTIRHRLLFVAWAALLASPPSAIAQRPTPADEHVARADALTAQLNHDAALTAYRQALAADPGHAGAAWKLARTYVRLGETASDRDRKAEMYRAAVKAATAATEAHPREADAFTVLAVALGRLSGQVDAREALELSKATRKAVDRAIALNPADDTAWQVLGQWHRRLATLGAMERTFANMFLGGVPADASVDTAIECFKKAAQLNPDHGGHYLELGATYARLDRRAEAIQAYQKVLQLPVTGPNGPQFRETATAALEKLGAK